MVGMYLTTGLGTGLGSGLVVGLLAGLVAGGLIIGFTSGEGEVLVTIICFNGGRFQALTASFPVLVNGNRMAKQTSKNTAARIHQIRARKLVMEGLCPASSVSL